MKTQRWACLLLTAACLALAGCGGGASGPIPEAHAQTPTAPAPADNTAQIQAMIDSGVVALPAGTFSVSQSLVIKNRVQMRGAGQGLTVIKSSAAEALVIDASTPNRFSTFRDFSIVSATPGGGSAAFVVRLRPGGFFANFKFEGVEFGDFGGPSLVFDNSVGNENGIFTGEVGPLNWVTCGIKFVGVGDSVTVMRNTITAGTKPCPGIEASGRDGARKLLIDHNNITASGGCIYLHDINGPEVIGNICEHPSYLGLPYSSAQPGFLQFTNVTLARVVGNSVNLAGLARYGMAFSGGSLNSITDNDFGLGTDGHLAFLGGSSQNRMPGLNTYRGGADPTVGKITNAATGLLNP